MFGWHLPRYGPIGVDIGNSHIKLFQVFCHSTDLRVRYCSRPRPADDDQTADLLKAMIRQARLWGNRAVVSLDNNGLKVTSIRIANEGRDVLGQARKEAICRLGLDTNDYQIGCIQAGQAHQSGQARQEVIVLAARNQQVDRQVTLLERVGLRLVGLEPGACALARAGLTQDGPAGGSTVIVDVGSVFTTVVVAAPGQIQMIKLIRLGITNLCTEICGQLGIEMSNSQSLYDQWVLGQRSSDQPKLDPSLNQAVEDSCRPVLEQLANEIGSCIRYCAVTFRGQGMERLILAGGGAYNQRFIDLLKVQYKIPVHVARPLRRLGSEWAVAAGLAVRDLQPFLKASHKAFAQVQV